MEKYKLPLTGALIALGLLLGGMAIGSAIIGVMDMSRVVNVKGLLLTFCLKTA